MFSPRITLFLLCCIGQQFGLPAALSEGLLYAAENAQVEDDDDVTRVFIFAGQSNMEGADSNINRVDSFPPFEGLGQEQSDVLFSYNLGRNDAYTSEGWVRLRSVNQWVGPELSFVREIRKYVDSPIAIIKCAVGGTTLGEDWNPDQPGGFMLYPKALKLVRDSLAELTKRDIRFRVEGLMWHQGENDMFNDDYRASYGDHLSRFIQCWRRDLGISDLRIYVGELHCKSVWGMDNRQRMYELSQGQKAACGRDERVEYVPNNHNGMTIDQRTGLHYHFGTLGQLGHGMEYAKAYLSNINQALPRRTSLKVWPHRPQQRVKLYILAGHRNMEGERAFTAHLDGDPILADNHVVPFRYSIGGGVSVSDHWEALGPAGFYETFGPELSFAHRLAAHDDSAIAIGKFTHSGSQILDWTPEGSIAEDRNLYGKWISFIKDCLRDLKGKGHDVELAGIVYHMGENDMCFYPYKKNAVARLSSIIKQSRVDLNESELKWLVSSQQPFPNESLEQLDVANELISVAETDPHLRVLLLPEDFPLDRNLLMDAHGVKRLGELLAKETLFLDQ